MTKKSKPPQGKNKKLLSTDKKAEHHKKELSSDNKVRFDAILSELSEDKRTQLIRKLSTEINSPYPPPGVLKEYEAVKAGTIEKIFNAIDKNAENRIELNKHEAGIERRNIELDEKHLEQSYSLAKRGQCFALVFGLSGFACATICAFLEQTVIGTAILGPSFVIFIRSLYGVHKSKKSDKDQ